MVLLTLLSKEEGIQQVDHQTAIVVEALKMLTNGVVGSLCVR